MNLKSLVSLTIPFRGRKYPTPFAIVLVAYISIAFWSSWFVLGNNQSGVVQLFGAHVRTVGPGGIHGKFPWPLETLTEVGTTNLYQMEIGFRTEGDPKNKKYVENVAEAEMFSGDMNLVQIDFTNQYQTSDAPSWLFHVNHPEVVLRALAESSIRNVVGGNSFDDVVTSGRGIVSAEVTKTMQVLVDKIGMGAHIGQINLQDAHPPKEVMAAFRDVNGAREDKEKLIQQGLGYYNGNIPKARATANQKIENANGYKNRRIAEAKGDADRFSAVLDKYNQAPEITKQRMRFEALNAILPGKDQLVDLGGNGNNLLKFFDVNRQPPQAPHQPKEAAKAKE